MAPEISTHVPVSSSSALESNSDGSAIYHQALPPPSSSSAETSAGGELFSSPPCMKRKLDEVVDRNGVSEQSHQQLVKDAVTAGGNYNTHSSLEGVTDRISYQAPEPPAMVANDKAGLSLLFAASLLQQREPVPTTDNITSSGDASGTEPRELDVLCGRGGGINKHCGNIIYRRVVEYNKAVYRQVPKRHRMMVSQSIVQAILNTGGRFLQHEGPSSAKVSLSDGTKVRWKEVQFRRAVQKTSQALRERSEEEGKKEDDEEEEEEDTTSSYADEVSSRPAPAIAHEAL